MTPRTVLVMVMVQYGNGNTGVHITMPFKFEPNTIHYVYQILVRTEFALSMHTGMCLQNLKGNDLL